MLNDNRQPLLVPEPTLRRLPWYLSSVTLLQDQGVDYVSSTRLSRELNVDASMIAKDLSYLNIKGKTRIGYDVAALRRSLEQFLGFMETHNAVIVGVGNLGAALMTDSGLANYGLDIVAGFDIRPEIVGSSIKGIPVFHVDDLAVQCKRLDAEIGIIAVPVRMAQDVAHLLADAGVKALWNFTPCRILPPEGLVIQNTSIYAHLAVMYNRLK
ncbi:MAG: redox-sensing transcriptional repressor Rex [Muribaculaceae bacterium]|nr:redox-sensing transcriptional repressor Rex [Muribaculaceae bacterium]